MFALRDGRMRDIVCALISGLSSKSGGSCQYWSAVVAAVITLLR